MNFREAVSLEDLIKKFEEEIKQTLSGVKEILMDFSKEFHLNFGIDEINEILSEFGFKGKEEELFEEEPGLFTREDVKEYIEKLIKKYNVFGRANIRNLDEHIDKFLVHYFG